MPFPKFKSHPDHTFDMFPVGAKVRVDSGMVDWSFFNRTETGRVIRNSGKYLGIIAEFDNPRLYEDGHIQTEHNFNPCDLILLEAAIPAWDKETQADLNEYMAIG